MRQFLQGGPPAAAIERAHLRVGATLTGISVADRNDSGASIRVRTINRQNGSMAARLSSGRILAAILTGCCLSSWPPARRPSTSLDRRVQRWMAGCPSRNMYSGDKCLYGIILPKTGENCDLIGIPPDRNRVQEHPRVSSYIPFFICAKFLIEGQSMTSGVAKDFNANKKRDVRGTRRWSHRGSNRSSLAQRLAARTNGFGQSPGP